MKQLLPLLILLNCHMIQGILEWIVSGKVTDYGQDVTLFCNVSNCCPNDAGWDRYSPEQRTLFIDVKTGHSNKKYDGKTLRDGYTLVIKNLTQNDLNVSYACVYGVTIGQSKFLWKEDVFTYISDTTPNPPNDNSRLSELQIAGITIGIYVLVGVAVAIFLLFLKETRKKGHISEGDSTPLLDCFLEDPSNIECIEGEDATLTCKVRTGGQPVQWKKGSTAITSNANYSMRDEDTEHNLIIKNFKPSDSGEYTVEVGKFSKTIKLAIKDYFLEDPSNIECIEGKDATLTCKVRAGSPPVQWKKGSTAITSNENCLMSNKDTEYNLILKNVKPSDSGEYCVEVGQFSKTIKLTIKDDEEKILERKKHLHQMILNDECVKHYYARVMFIGKYGVGKTSLMRRLLGLGKHAAINTKSTDGVSISKCMINVQNGKWRPCDKTDDDLARLIKHVFAENKDKTKDNVAHKTKSSNTKREMMKDVADHQEKEQPEKSDLIKTPTKNVSSSITPNIDLNVNEETKEDNYEATNQTNQEAAMQDDTSSKIDEHNEDQFDVNHTKELQRKELDNIDKEVNDSVSITSNSSTVLNEKCNITVDEDLCQTTRNDDLTKMTSDIIDKYVQNSDASQPQKQEGFASCWLWDFAGQNDFYATHQAFLSSCAVYILVADSLEFSAKEELWIDFKKSAQYVRFWCDAVHCYCQTTDNEDMLDPAIVIVHTKKDAHKEKSIQEDHHNAFVKNIGNVLLGQDQKKHIRDTLNVSNTEDGDDVFEHIRKSISALASEMENWGVEIPLKWFLFQQVIEKLKENKVPISTTKKVQQMASHKDIGITDDDDFRKCLLYFHDVGTIIYYDEEGLNENVILDPKWLIDAFRCLVSHQISNETKIGDDWCTLQETGKITTSLLSKLLQKKTDYTIDFHEHKDHLIEVMKKFDIIVHMIDSRDLYMPCMMKDCSLDFVKRNFITDTSDKTSWLCLRFDFLPPVFFNHIIARYMKIYRVSSSMDTEKGDSIHALYRKIAVFDLPNSRCKQLILCQAPNILAVQIWFTKGDHTKEYRKYREDLDIFVQNLKSRYKLNIMYKVEFACKDGGIERGRTNLCDLNEPEYRCKYHNNNIHSSGDLLNWWYTKDESENERQKQLKDQRDCFLEDPSNVEYIEGDDATLTCKLRPTSLPVEWMKDGRAVKLDENCKQSNEGVTHKLIIKNVKSDYSGEYCVKVGNFSRKIHLKIEDITLTHDDSIPKHVQEQFERRLEQWKKDDEQFVSTKSEKHLMQKVLTQSSVTLIGNSGTGKSFLSKHIALIMKKHGYTVIPCFKPEDISKWFKHGRKTLFVIDDVCGRYTLNQQIYTDWKQRLDPIKSFLEDKCCKIISTCRMEVYRNELFSNLSIFKICTIDLSSQEHKHTAAEKLALAKMYFQENSDKVKELSEKYDFFPLLCSLYRKQNLQKNVSVFSFLSNPFRFFKDQLVQMYGENDAGKLQFCSLVLCVMFNNTLTEENLSQKDKKIDAIIEVLLQECELSKGTSIKRLKKSLEILQGTYVVKEDSRYKIIHEQLFDFLAKFFGEKMIQIFIDHAHTNFIEKRFLWKTSDSTRTKIEFLIVISERYIDRYIERLLKDWEEGYVNSVCHNRNMHSTAFTKTFVTHLNQLDISKQQKLVCTKDIYNKDIALTGSCYIGNIELVKWLISRNSDVNYSREDGCFPLFLASQEGHVNVVTKLLEHSAEVNQSNKNGVSPLNIACHNGHFEVVRKLLHHAADVNIRDVDGKNALYVAHERGHLEVEGLLLRHASFATEYKN